MSELFKDLPRASPTVSRISGAYRKSTTGENVTEINQKNLGAKFISNTSMPKKSTTCNIYIKES